MYLKEKLKGDAQRPAPLHGVGLDHSHPLQVGCSRGTPLKGTGTKRFIFKRRWYKRVLETRSKNMLVMRGIKLATNRL